MKDYKKTLLTISLSSFFALSFASDFVAIIGIEEGEVEKIGVIEKNITPWVDDGSQYNCSDWNPEESAIDYGVIFEQSQSCSQNQTRTKDIYSVYNNGNEVFERTETENQTIIVENKRNNTGTKKEIDSQREEPWSSWVNINSVYDCDSWSPDPATENLGLSFEQKRNCSQDQERTKNIYDVWNDGTETLNRTEIENQTISIEEKQNATGTKNYVASQTTSTSSWANSGGVYNCGSWSPAASTIESGKTFTQTRTCKRNQTATETTYNNWADGTQTVDSTKQVSKTVNETQTQQSTGTKLTGTWKKKSSKTECVYNMAGGETRYPSGSCAKGASYNSDIITGSCGRYPERERASWKCE